MDDSKEPGGVQAVLFALEILEHVALQSQPVGVTAVADHFRSNKSKVFRHLRTLAQLGYIVQEEESERYRAGARLIVLANIVSNSVDIVAVADPEMRKVRDALGHSVVLSLADRDGMRVAAVRSGPSPVEVTVKPGSLLAYHASAQGKAALAYADATRIRKLAARGLAQVTEGTISDPAALERHLAQVRRRGWAVAPNEAVMGLNALAVPIFNAAGQVTATLAVVDTIQAIPATPRPEQVEALATAAATISAAIGYRGGAASQAG